MANVTDEINDIKKYGNPYDNQTDTQRNNQQGALVGFSKELTRLKEDRGWGQYSQPTFLGNYLPEDFGESTYDDNITFNELVSAGRSLEDIRAEQQGMITQLGNNLLNMGTIAATTFADSFIGTAAGVLNMAFSPYDQTGLSIGGEALNKFINNPVSLWLNSINKKVKENAPTYSPDEYRLNQENGEWWKNMGTSQFWGESIMENAGFTLGMVASGKLSGSLMNKFSNIANQTNILKQGVNEAIAAGKISGNADDIVTNILKGKQSLQGVDVNGALKNAAESIGKSGALTSMASTAIAVTGESRMEAIHSSEEYKESMLQRLESSEGIQELAEKTLMNLRVDDKYAHMFKNTSDGMPTSELKPEYAQQFNELVEENKSKALHEIDNAAARVAGWDFALNFPILYGSSLWQFGKAFSGGYNTQKGFLNNIKGAIRGDKSIAHDQANRIIREGDKYLVKGSITPYLKAMSNPLVEANEEMLQGVASEASFRIAGSKMNSFMGYKLDPESEQNSISSMNEILNAIVKTYSDPAAYEEGFAGFIMGGTGSLNFTMSKNARTGKRRLFDGGVYGEIMEARSDGQDLNAIAEALNKRVQSPEFLNYYQGKIRHAAFEQDKQKAMQEDNKFEYENAEHAQLISDIITFEKAGKLQDLIDTIEQGISEYSTEDATKVKELATELRELGKNQETGVDMYKNLTDKEILEKVVEKNQSMKNAVDNYREIASNLEATIGNKFEKDELEELTYLLSKMDNMDTRYDSLLTGLKEKLNSVKARGLNNKLFKITLQDVEERLTLQEILTRATPKELMQFIVDNTDIKTLIDREDTKTKTAIVKGLSSKRKATIDKFTKQLQDYTSLAENITTDLVDLALIDNARSDAINLYNKYTGNPYFLKETKEQETIKAAEEQGKVKEEPLVERVRTIDNVRELDTLIKDEVKNGNKSIANIVRQSAISDNSNYNPIVAEYKRAMHVMNEFESLESIKQGGMLNAGQYGFIVQKVREALYNKLIDEGSVDALDINNYTLEDFKDLPRLNQEVSFTQDELNKMFEVLNNSLNELKASNAFVQSLLKSATTTAPQKQEHKKDTAPTAKVPVGGGVDTKNSQSTEGKAESNHVDVPPPGSPVSITELKNGSKSISDGIHQMNTVSRGSWTNGVFEIDIDYYNQTGLIRTQRDPMYKRSVDYLMREGAFNAVNDGIIKRGSKVKLLASQAYWDYLKENADEKQVEWVNENKPLLLIIETQEGSQIVGTFSNHLNSALHSKVIGDAQSSKEFISTEELLVDKVLPGRLGFTDNEQFLELLLSTNKPGGGPIGVSLGVMMDTGDMQTNLPIDAVPPNLPIDKAKGRVYLMVKGANGVYLPSAVRVKNLSEIDLDSDSILIKRVNTFIQNAIKQGMTGNEEVFDNAIRELRNLLYVGGKSSIGIHLREANVGVHREVNIVVTNQGETTHIINLFTQTPDGQTQFAENPVSEFTKALIDNKAQFQISQAKVNTGNYNSELIESGILTSNLQYPYVRGAAFTIQPLSSELKPITAPSKNQNNNNPDTTNPMGTVESQRVTVEFDLDTYIIDKDGMVYASTGGIIKNKDLITDIKAQHYLNGLSENKKATMFVPNSALDNDSLQGTYYRFPDGRVWTGTGVVSADSFVGIIVNRAYDNLHKTKDPTTQTEQGTGIQRPNNRTIKSRMTRTAIDSGKFSTPETTTNNVEEMVEQNKEYQEENCNGILPKEKLDTDKSIYSF